MERTAAIYIVIENGTLNGVEPQAYIADVIQNRRQLACLALERALALELAPRLPEGRRSRIGMSQFAPDFAVPMPPIWPVK